MKNLISLEYQIQSKKLVGGKARLLQKLIQLGYRVPNGFVIPVDAFSQERSELEGQILSAFSVLDAEYVAVRSSAIEEDSASHAWAGQLSSFLNVEQDGLLEAVYACRNSVNQHHAQHYAEQGGFEESDLELAVIVQKMIQSECSGVAFSINPVTGATNQLVIEAVYGLGESLVSGQVDPDTYILDAEGVVLSQDISTQENKLVLQNGKNEWQAVPAEQKEQPKLTTSQLKQLAKTLKQLRKNFGFEVDIEWGIENDQIYILQSRPITTL